MVTSCTLDPVVCGGTHTTETSVLELLLHQREAQPRRRSLYVTICDSQRSTSARKHRQQGAQRLYRYSAAPPSGARIAASAGSHAGTGNACDTTRTPRPRGRAVSSCRRGGALSDNSGAGERLQASAGGGRTMGVSATMPSGSRKSVTTSAAAASAPASRQSPHTSRTRGADASRLRPMNGASARSAAACHSASSSQPVTELAPHASAARSTRPSPLPRSSSRSPGCSSESDSIAATVPSGVPANGASDAAFSSVGVHASKAAPRRVHCRGRRLLGHGACEGDTGAAGHGPLCDSTRGCGGVCTATGAHCGTTALMRQARRKERGQQVTSKLRARSSSSRRAPC